MWPTPAPIPAIQIELAVCLGDCSAADATALEENDAFKLEIAIAAAASANPPLDPNDFEVEIQATAICGGVCGSNRRLDAHGRMLGEPGEMDVNMVIEHVGVTGQSENVIGDAAGGIANQIDQNQEEIGNSMGTNAVVDDTKPIVAEVIQVPAPTFSPTNKPTKEPTKDPTSAPTKVPTPVPTKVPTKDPTPAPTKEPTKDPTPGPTKVPTPAPTKVPTKDPTPVPTDGTDGTRSPEAVITRSPSARKLTRRNRRSRFLGFVH